MKMKKGQASIIWTIVLILTGILILLSSFDIITIENNIYFYTGIAVMGIIFHLVCFMNKPKKYNLLVPGGMMIIYAALFVICEYSKNLSLDALWPVIILAAAFGMLEQRVFSKGTEGSWLSIIVISVVGFYFLIQNNPNFSKIFAALLILMGLFLVIRISRKLPQETNEKIDNSDLDSVKIPAVKKEVKHETKEVPPIEEDEFDKM